MPSKKTKAKGEAASSEPTPKPTVRHDIQTKESPIDTTNWFSRLWFSYLDGLIWQGFKSPLSMADLWKVPKSYEVSKATDEFDRLWHAQEKKSVGRIVARLAGARYWAGAGILLLVWAAAAMLLSGYVLRELVAWLQNYATRPEWEGWVLAAGMFVTTLVSSLLVHHFFVQASFTGFHVRGVIIAAIYRKALRLSSVTTSVGEIVNLQSNDSKRILEMLRYGHFLWLTPATIIAVGGLLIQQLGWVAALCGTVTALLVMPAQSVMGRLIGRIKRNTLPLTDERVRLMAEIIGSIKLVKLYNWEQSFFDETEHVRAREMAGLTKIAILKGLNLGIALISGPLTAFVAFSISVTMGYPFEASTAFTTLALFNIMRFPLSVLPNIVKATAESLVAFRRLNAFFAMPEIDDTRIISDDSTTEIALKASHASFQYDQAMRNHGPAPSKKASKLELRTIAETNQKREEDAELKRFTLKDLNFKVKRGELLAVVAVVGSGKSSLLLSLAGQVKKIAGDLSVNGKVAYVSQQAWLTNDTVKNNILFGLPYDEKRYMRTIAACQLTSDLAQLPAEDETEVGERGINLSGGQKARLSLARAVYSDRDIYLLDDPLSAVDQHVGKGLFKECIRGVLRHKTVIFVTNQLQYLGKCDRIMTLRGGKMEELGAYEQLMENGGEFSKLIKDHVVMENVQSDDDIERIGSSVPKPAREANGHGPAATETNAVEVSKKTHKSKEELETQREKGKLTTIEDRTTGSVAGKTYAKYFSSGGVFLTIIVSLLYLLTQGIRVASDWFVSYWSQTSTSGIYSNHFYIGIYAALLGAYIISIVAKALLFALFALRASTNLHNGVFSSVLRAPMAFFDSTPLGRILNRFTKDQDNIDDMLPDVLDQAVGSLLIVLSSVGLIIAVLYWFAIAIVPLLAIFYFIGLLYRRSSREVKRLEGVSRSPIFAHLSGSLNGLATIRAYGVEGAFEEANREKVDVNNSPQMYFEVLARWLALRLDLVSTIVVTVTSLLVVGLRENIPASLSALALSYAVQTTGMLQWGIRNTAEAENQMTSTERLLAYTNDLEHEAPGIIPENRPPANWPEKPVIEYKKVEVRYHPHLDPALKRVSFKIQAHEKIGIIGRTGAGKSTLATSLFRIIEPTHGKILIDGIDVLKIGLDDLRSKLAIIPQDPVLFKNTVRYNLDPFGKHDDSVLWEALDKVFLKQAISDLPDKLDTLVQENGANFSMGIRQLVCFGRALLRGSKILVLDEATASIDNQTDEKIQRTIRETFSYCTVLTIAHRLHTIVDSDRIMVLDKGDLAEFDTPAALLSDPESKFSKLVDDTGTETAQFLRDIAFGKRKMFSSRKIRRRKRAK